MPIAQFCAYNKNCSNPPPPRTKPAHAYVSVYHGKWFWGWSGRWLAKEAGYIASVDGFGRADQSGGDAFLGPSLGRCWPPTYVFIYGFAASIFTSSFV